MTGANNPFLCVVPFRWRRLWNYTARDGTRVKSVMVAKTHRQIWRGNFVETNAEISSKTSIVIRNCDYHPFPPHDHP